MGFVSLSFSREQEPKNFSSFFPGQEVGFRLKNKAFSSTNEHNAHVHSLGTRLRELLLSLSGLREGKVRRDRT
jgi:hypothetical protein